jgi:hypothetical protein
MGKLDNVKRIIAEDFKTEDRDLVRKLAFVLNRFMEQVVGIINGDVDFENLAEDIKTFKITVDASGVPTSSDLVRSNVANPSGIDVIRAINKTTTSTYPTNAPFINYRAISADGKVLKILKITGLQAANEYELTIRVVPKIKN